MKVVSVHVGKAAGTSLLAGWEHAVGEERVLRHYATDAFGRRSPVDIHEHRLGVWWGRRRLSEHYDIVHGHFDPEIYRPLGDVPWVIVLREPVARLRSAAEQWTRRLARNRPLPRPEMVPLVRAAADDPTGLVPLARLITESPRWPAGFRRRGFREHLGRRGLEDFAVVGLVERYPETLARIEEVTGVAVPDLRRNVSDKSEPVDESVRRALEDVLADEVAVYHEAVDRFDRGC